MTVIIKVLVIIFNHYWIIHHPVGVTVDKASKKSRVQFMHRKGTHETNKDQDQHIINALKTVIWSISLMTKIYLTTYKFLYMILPLLVWRLYRIVCVVKNMYDYNKWRVSKQILRIILWKTRFFYYNHKVIIYTNVATYFILLQKFIYR